MAYQRFADKRTRLYIKDTNRMVPCPSYDPLGIWGPVDDPHVSIMVLQDVNLALSGRGIPYGNRIVACSREVVSIRRICKPTYLDGYSTTEAEYPCRHTPS